jgi:hypothetical protein
MRLIPVLLMAASALCGQPTPEATANRFFDRAGGFTASLRSVRLNVSLTGGGIGY